MCRFLHSRLPTRGQTKKAGAISAPAIQLVCARINFLLARYARRDYARRCHGAQALRRGLTVKSRT